MYGRNLSHTFSNEQSLINPSNVASLQLTWTFPTGDAVSASPTAVDEVVYVGSWDGYFYAIHAHSGKLKWKFKLDCQYTVSPIPNQCLPLPQGFTLAPRVSTDGGIVTSSAAVIDGVVYFGGGKTLYALKASNGDLLWKHVICGNPEEFACALDPFDPTRIFSSPAVFGGLVFVGQSVDGVNHYRGGFEAIEAATGKIRWRFELDPILSSQGHAVGVYNRGCGNVWSSAAIDTNAGLVFFGTTDCHDDATPPYHEAVLALEAGTGKLRWVFHRHQLGICDIDFGASPNIIDLGKGSFVGIGAKDGTYYLLNRLTQNPTGELVWQRNVVFGGYLGGFYGGAAFDGAHIFSATGIGDFNPFTPAGPCSSDPRDTALQEPSMHALNAADGSILWEQPKSSSPSAQPQNNSLGATSLGDGVVFSGLVGPFPAIGLTEPAALHAFDAENGTLLATFPMPGAVNSAATPVGNMLFVTSGNSTDGTGGGVHAFALPGEIALKRR
jgi:outer membrane protein assembly factor BamB